MTRPTENTKSTQPTIDSLMVRFLASRSDAAHAAVEMSEGEVEPHEVVAGFQVDPRAAWLDATAAFTIGGNAPPPAGLPTEWSSLVAQPATAFALPMAAGHFPQRVKDLQPLLVQSDLGDLRPHVGQHPVPGFSGLRNWLARNGSTQPHVAAGIARILGDFNTAANLLTATECENDRAALLWATGECEAAQAAWDAAAESPAVLFNRGMARLFLGHIAESREWLRKAVEAIPEASGWNALARLYLAVAEIRG